MTLLSRSWNVPKLGHNRCSRAVLLSMVYKDTFILIIKHSGDAGPGNAVPWTSPAWLISLQGCAQSARTELTVMQ